MLAINLISYSIRNGVMHSLNEIAKNIKNGSLPLVWGICICIYLILEKHDIIPRELMELSATSRFFAFAAGFGLILSGLGLIIKSINREVPEE